MRDGIRRQIFKTLVQELPQGTNKMLGARKIWDAVIELIEQQDEEKAINEVLDKFKIYVPGEKDEYGFTAYRRAKDIEEFCKYQSGFLNTKERVLYWYATNRHVGETDEALKWLENEGYIRTWNKPARFGWEVYVGVTAKGWSVAHLYR